MGTTLAHLLKTYQKGNNPKFGACFVCPPVGNFTAHETTTNANVRVLPSHWGESWCQGGTRKDEECGHAQHRWLCHYTESGPPDWIEEVRPDNDTSKWWKTMAHDEHPDHGLGVQWWHVAEVLKDSEGLCTMVVVKLKTNSEEPVAFQMLRKFKLDHSRARKYVSVFSNISEEPVAFQRTCWLVLFELDCSVAFA